MLRKNFKTVEQAFFGLLVRIFLEESRFREIFFFKIMLHIKKLTGFGSYGSHDRKLTEFISFVCFTILKEFLVLNIKFQ